MCFYFTVFRHLNFICMFCLHVCLMPTETRRGHWALDPLEQELQTVVVNHVGAGNQIQILGKCGQWSKFLSHLSNPRRSEPRTSQELGTGSSSELSLVQPVSV